MSKNGKTEKYKKCPVCGNEQISDQDNFCTNCGAKLRTICNCWVKKAATTAVRVAAQGTGYITQILKSQIPKRCFINSHPKSIMN